MKSKAVTLALLFFVFGFCCVSVAYAQTAEFAYQGNLKDGANPANGNYDFEFALFDALSGGNQTGATLTRNAVAVSGGNFAVKLDFGNQFPGANRFLEIRVRPSGGGALTPLTPRQIVNSSPYSVKTLSADTATTATFATTATSATTANNFSTPLAGDVTGPQNATVLASNAVTATKIADLNVTDAKIAAVAGSKITGLITTATIPGANVTGTVANAATAASAVNFSGTLAGDVTGTQAATAIGNNVVTTAKILDANVTDAKINTVGGGKVIGSITTATIPGVNVIGTVANATNATNATTAATATNAAQLGGQAAAFYQNAANLNAGTLAPSRLPVPLSLTGSVNGNAIINGTNAGTSGIGAFFDATASTGVAYGVYGRSQSAGGGGAGVIGLASGTSGTTRGVQGESYSPSGTGVYGVASTTSGVNFGVIGRSDSPDGYGGYFNGRGYFSGSVGLGIGTPAAKLHVVADGSVSSDWQTSQIRISGAGNTNRQLALGYDTSTNVGVIQSGEAGVAFTTLSLNPQGGSVGIGLIGPTERLDVNGNIRLGTGTTGCLFNRGGSVIVGTCSSDQRFKKNIAPFGSVIQRFQSLRPVYFDWRADEFKERNFGTERSYGLVAQDVEKGFPELVTTDENGYRAVNYSMLPLITIKAVKEQQAQIETQNKQLGDQQKQIQAQQSEIDTQQKQAKEQKSEIDALRSLVCVRNRRAKVCRATK